MTGSASEGLLLASMPLLTVSITTNPQAVSLVNTAGQAPWLLLSLFAGVLIDRVRRATVMVLAYGIQLGAALVLGIAGSTGDLTLPLLMITAFTVTSSQVLGEGASGALLPRIVPAERLASANARLQVIDQGLVRFVVPPAAGALVAVSLSMPAWLACAMAASALVVARGIRSNVADINPNHGKAHPLRDIAGGLRYLVATPLLRSITITVAIGSFAASATTTMLVLYATQELGVGSVGYGALLTCFAAGWIVSSFIVDRFIARFGYSWAMRAAQSLAWLTPLVIAVAPAWPALVGAVLMVQSAGTLIWNVCSQSTRQRFTPPALLGRVLTSHKALAWGLTPIGALVGGLVATHWNLRGVWWMGAAIQAVGTVIVWRTLSPRAFARAALENGV